VLTPRPPPPRFRSTGFVRNPPRLPGALGASLRQWHDERWGDGRMARIGFTAEVLGGRGDLAIVFERRAEIAPDDGFAIGHVGAHARDIAGTAGPATPAAPLPEDHPLKTFVDYVAMVGDPVLVLGEAVDPDGRVQPQNVLLLPVVRDVRTVGWIVAVREIG
jgi:hypothetical protein